MSIISGTASKYAIKRVERNLRISARKILDKTKYESVKFEIYNCLKWLLPLDNYTYSALCFLYNIIKNSRFPYFDRFLKYRHEVHIHSTRNNAELYISFIPRNDYGKMSIAFKACNLWNQLPSNILESVSILTFKSQLKEHLLKIGMNECN